MKKIKVLTISDHPLSPSGVGTQSKYVIEALLETGKFKFVSLGGALKHRDYRPMKTEEWKDDWVIFPVDGYGNPEMIRSLIRNERPDILWFMTDPRFYEWLWGIENEIRPLVPMVYYHVWDNYPYPKYNNKFYKSNDVIACISKLTHDIVKNTSPETESIYVPHAVDPRIFKKVDMPDIKQKVCNIDDDKYIIFWNNRNARRKMSGSLIFWFKEFLEKIGNEKAVLIMHTDPKDQHGQDLERILEDLDLVEGQVRLSTQKLDPQNLAMIYNAVDLTVNISDAEGFGLATLESLSCETPILVNMTGGLQEQVTNGELWFGAGLVPASKAIIGSQKVPYIYEDRISGEDFVRELENLYLIWKNDREKYIELGKNGRNHVENSYNFENFKKQWVDIMTGVHEKYGSWENRKHYKNWDLIEV